LHAPSENFCRPLNWLDVPSAEIPHVDDACELLN
jgi:hypothetical protein